jgi:hypothetical protein
MVGISDEAERGKKRSWVPPRGGRLGSPMAVLLAVILGLLQACDGVFRKARTKPGNAAQTGEELMSEGIPYTSPRALASVFNAFADDPEIADFYNLNGRLQRKGYGIVVDTLARKRSLRSGLSPDDATTILLVLLGIDVYRSMLDDHGWTEQK